MSTGGAGYVRNMNDEATSQDPVIDLTSGTSIDDVEHPFAVAEQVINVAV